ncbi:MAG: hypothetical protein D6756_00555, partial [Cyanobacteria bacterium J083]
MSDRDGFATGFLLGTIIGGTIGGVLGALLVKKNSLAIEDKDKEKHLSEAEEKIEGTRKSLEEKIAQINLAIDDVREQLGS